MKSSDFCTTAKLALSPSKLELLQAFTTAAVGHSPQALYGKIGSGMELKGREREQLLLTRSDLIQLTGCRRVGAMVKWLLDRGWIFEPPGKRGHIPCVARDHFSQRMGVTSNDSPPSGVTQKDRPRPHLEFLSPRK